MRINLLISLATLLAAGAARASFVASTNVPAHAFEICAMLAGGVVAAWIGAGVLGRLPKARVISVISVLLIAIAGLLVAETLYAGATALVLPHDLTIRTIVAVVAGLLVGGVSSMLGVAGGELIIPIMMFVFGADIRTAGSASILISIPIVVTGVARHILTGHFRSRSMLTFLVLPMSAGSLLGAIVGGFAAAYAPTDTLRIVLAAILALSALKLARSSTNVR